jgi:UDP-glucose 4-epimerase
MRVLVTGGAGYIGSHVARLFLKSGFQVSVLDDLSTGDPWRIRVLAREGGAAFRFDRCDIRDRAAVDWLLGSTRPGTIIHLAGLKDVARSFVDPGVYQQINVDGTANLLAAAARHGTARFVFSSSAAVYGGPAAGPAREDDLPNPASPYGRSKLQGEALVRRWAFEAPQTRRGVVLRYFNPCASDPDLSSRRGDALGQALPLSEIVAAVAAGRRPCLEIYGRDHPTPDGTCRRDFVHIADISDAHLSSALRDSRRLEPVEVLNIGSGRDHSILEFLAVFHSVTGIAIPYRFRAARPGDAAMSCADITRAASRLGWRPMFGLNEICRALAADAPDDIRLRSAPVRSTERTRDAVVP